MSTRNRNMRDLMQSQDIASPLNRALKLNEQLEGMREKNVILYDQNQELTETNKSVMGEREGLVRLVKDLNTELKDLKVSSLKKEKRLREELRNMQSSWDSLYEEHRAAEERRKRELRVKNEKFVTDEDKINQQASFLCTAVKKDLVSSDTESPMEKKLHEIEEENKKLKSKVVQLQTKYREEKYKNDNGGKESDATSNTDSESVESVEKPPVNLLAGFKNRNMGRRQNTAPKFNTKNLWGRMTNARNAKQTTNFDFPEVNLAFSRDD